MFRYHRDVPFRYAQENPEVLRWYTHVRQVEGPQVAVLQFIGFPAVHCKRLTQFKPQKTDKERSKGIVLPSNAYPLNHQPRRQAGSLLRMLFPFPCSSCCKIDIDICCRLRL